MKFEGEIVCPFCIKPLTGKVVFRIPKLYRKALTEALMRHKPSCSSWNGAAWATQATKQ